MANSSGQGLKGLRGPMRMPIVVSLWACSVPMLVFAMPKIVPNWNAEFLSAHLFVIGTLGQALIDLPALILFARTQKEPGNESGAQGKTRQRVISAMIGMACAMSLAALRILIMGHLMEGRFMGGVPAFTQALGLGLPWNMLMASMALLAYGPGEAVFVVYLISAFDKAFGGPPALISRGVIITAFVWAAPHIFNGVFFGVNAIPNVVTMFFVGILMGILSKKTRSALGPMVFWTLVNGTAL
jgi:hypothetical protein